MRVNGKIQNDLQKATTPYDKLLVAAAHGHIPLATALIQSGVNINPDPSENLATPLYTAAVHGQTEMVNFLIEKGADVNLTSCSALKGTPATGAYISKNLSICLTLLQHGAKIHFTNDYIRETTKLHENDVILGMKQLADVIKDLLRASYANTGSRIIFNTGHDSSEIPASNIISIDEDMTTPCASVRRNSIFSKPEPIQKTEPVAPMTELQESLARGFIGFD